MTRRNPPRAKLRITDLKQRDRQGAAWLTFALPLSIHRDIARLARRLGATRTAVVTALLNEGLAAAGTKLGRGSMR